MFPQAFRDRYAAAMQELLFDMKTELGSRPAPRRVVRLYVAVTWDVLRRVRAEHRRARRRQTSNPGGGTMMRWTDDLRQDVKVALRSLGRAPVFAAVGVLTLGIGIGANAAVFSAVSGVLLRPLPYPDPDRLVLIFNRYPNLGIERGGQNPGDFLDYQRQTDVFDTIAAFGGSGTQTLTGLGPADRVTLAGVTDDLFPMLGVRPVLGRLFEADDDWTSVLLSYGFWQTRFGGADDVLGRTFQMNGNTMSVVGVLPPDFLLHAPAHLGLPANIAVWNPIRRFLGTPENPDRTAHWMTVIAKLSPDATPEQAQSQLDAVARWQRENFAVRAERDARIDVVSMHEEIVDDVRPTLFALFGAVGFVLLIACANLANLLLARGQTRRREIAVRAALGGSRLRLVRHVLAESGVLAVFGGALGITLAYLGVGVIHALRPHDLPFVGNISVDRGVLAFVFVAAIGSTALFSLIPAVTASRVHLTEFLGSRDGSGSGVRARRLKSALVVLEVALSMILLVGGGLMIRSFLSLGDVSPGYRTDNVLTLVAGLPREVFQVSRQPGQTNTRYQDFYVRAEAALAAVPGVEASTAIWPTPLSGSSEGYSTYTDSEEAGNEQSQLASSQLITPGYFETMGIPIVAGRSFNMEDSGDKLVIDQRMADKMWPGENPLGKRLKIGWWSGPVWGEVVGVAANVRTLDLREEDPVTVYRKAAVYSYTAPTIVVRTSGDPLALTESVRRAVQSLHPTVAVEEMRTLSSYQDEQLAPTRFVMTLISIFAGIALLFAAVGLYGVITYLVSQRTREIGVRLAFGARGSQVFGLVLRQGLALTGLGIALGVAGAMATTQLLSSYLFAVEPTDPVTLACVALLLGSVAIVACARPALRATQVDPARSLAAE
jgi:predicted permease